MEPTTIRLSENTLETLASEAGARGRSRSEYIREIINDRHADDRLRDDYEAQIADYEERIDTLETENERLRRQLAATNARQDDVDALVEYVEEELSYREAGLGTRVKWFLFGKE